MKLLLGWSLSFCVKDIFEGKISIDDVLAIASGTSFTNDESSWELLLDSYSKSYWIKDPKKCKEIANRLRNRIVQPETFLMMNIHQGLTKNWTEVEPPTS